MRNQRGFHHSNGSLVALVAAIVAIGSTAPSTIAQDDDPGWHYAAVPPSVCPPDDEDEYPANRLDPVVFGAPMPISDLTARSGVYRNRESEVFVVDVIGPDADAVIEYTDGVDEDGVAHGLLVCLDHSFTGESPQAEHDEDVEVTVDSARAFGVEPEDLLITVRWAGNLETDDAWRLLVDSVFESETIDSIGRYVRPPVAVAEEHFYEDRVIDFVFDPRIGRAQTHHYGITRSGSTWANLTLSGGYGRAKLALCRNATKPIAGEGGVATTSIKRWASDSRHYRSWYDVAVRGIDRSKYRAAGRFGLAPYSDKSSSGKYGFCRPN